MVLLTRIYTKSGDKGKTSLGSGKRVIKHSLRIDAIGTVDETNATIGLCRLYSSQDIDEILSRIQNDLFDIGADLCMPASTKDIPEPLRMTKEQVTFLEKTIDAYNAKLSPLTSFVLPGGTPLSAYLHLARTITRRAERIICALKEEDDSLNDSIIHYLNRLSDLFFVLARTANDNGKGDVLWKPGANRN